MRPHYCMKNSSRQDEKNRVKWEHGFWELIRNKYKSQKKRMDEVVDVRYRMYLQSREYQC